VKKIIAFTSFLFVLLMTALPLQASHVSAANNVDITGIKLLTSNDGEIKVSGKNNNYTLDLVGVPGDVEVEDIQFTSDNAIHVSLLSINDPDFEPEFLDTYDIKFVDGVAYLNKDKLVNWYERAGELSDEEIPVLDTNYLMTVQEMRDWVAELLEGEPIELFVADANGNESVLTINFKTDGWKLENGNWYYYDNQGVKVKGWINDGNKWYFLGKDFAMETGWEFINGKYYFFDKNGAMKTGWFLEGKTWYYLDQVNGDMKTGWYQVGGKWYFSATSGAMKTGWLQTGGKWYYLYSNGSMASNTTIGGYRLASNGAWIR
jgi:hypothetical protein